MTTHSPSDDQGGAVPTGRPGNLAARRLTSGPAHDGGPASDGPTSRALGPTVDGPAPDESAELVDLLHTLVHALRRESADDGIAPGQLRFLRTLDRVGGTARPGSLATALNLAPRSVTTKVDLAEADGLVQRRQDPTDRRATVVALTDRGTAVLNRVAADRSRGVSARLARLSPDDRATLLALLRRLAGE